MIPFSRRWDCPKCGAFAPRPDTERLWVPSYTSGHSPGAEVRALEYLLWSCPECGYLERMACKDAAP